MALINNSIESLYNGVSQQSSEHRQNTQVKEMINAYPTIDRGLLRRNPTKKLSTSSSITFSDNMWTHSYDRGLGGASEESYIMSISDDGGLEIIDSISGDIYKDGAGLTYEGTAKEYLSPFGGLAGYSATTIKDTTFIVNKNKIPTMSKITSNPETVTKSGTVNETRIGISTAKRFEGVVNGSWYRGALQAPYTIFQVDGVDNLAYSYTLITINGTTLLKKLFMNTDEQASGRLTPSAIYDSATGYATTREPDTFVETKMVTETFDEWRLNLVSLISDSFTEFEVSLDSASDEIVIKSIDGTVINVTTEIRFFDAQGSLITTGGYTESDWIGSVTQTSYTGNIVDYSATYETESYLWIKSANPAYPYSYFLEVIDSNGTTRKFTTTGATTTEGAASSIATAVNAEAHLTAVAENSIVKITSSIGKKITSIVSGDSYGNQASFSWGHKVQYANELPAHLGFDNAIVQITGNGTNSDSMYWLKFEDGRWSETVSPSDLTEISRKSMPHILVRNNDNTFTFKEYDSWDNRTVGDSQSNPPPSFIQTARNTSPTIRDIFFFKNRLGLITDKTVVMSEVGNYGNFWRTTTATLLDSDPIDTTVDTTKAIRLEYATYLEDSVMLFSDKVQFKLEGGKILSPASVQISQTSAYEINKLVRPFYMNDKIFFCARRGDHTAVMQYQVKSSNTSSEAIDITAHVQTYIPYNVTMLSGDPINNMLFLSTYQSDTVYVYKYYDVGQDRMQSAWFKWQFNGNIYRALNTGKNVSIFINRENYLIAEDWVLGTGTWESNKLWNSSMTWISQPSNLVSQNQLESMSTFPSAYSGNGFKDLIGTSNETLINTNVNFGEWVASINGKKDIRGILKFKSVMISSEPDSDFGLYVNDRHRGDTRVIESKYTVDRKPMVYGDARNIEIGISSTSDKGFRINTVNYEGSFNSRSTKQ